jgi:Mn-dependent DtxR family transcriptional regulator
MQGYHGLELSPRKVEYLKFIREKGPRVNTNVIADRFHVDPSTITKTIAELAQGGYLAHVPYHGVSLTPGGREYAEFLVRRHRILVIMLSHYGLSAEKACDEASRFESFVSRDAIDRICRSLGHPMLGPCGTIPHDLGCCPATPSGKETRSAAPAEGEDAV